MIEKTLEQLFDGLFKAIEESKKSFSEKLKSLKIEPAPTFGEIEILGRKHKTVIIGEREYLAENLYLPELGFHYDNDPKNSENGYGTLHTHYAIPSINELLPEGWRVMTDEDFTKLVKFCGEDAGHKLKSKTGWEDNGNGTDDYGFNSKPAGLRYEYGSYPFNRGYNTYYWSSSVVIITSAWSWRFNSNIKQALRPSNNRSYGFSVRCVRNLK